jgi:hypothetical protein
MTGPAQPELPPALAGVSLDDIEELERETGESFGRMIEELASGAWSISTMRHLLALVDPGAQPKTLGELLESAGGLMGSGSVGKAPGMG